MYRPYFLDSLIHRTRSRSQLGFFCLSLFFVLLTDSMLAYAFPILVADYLHSRWLMGLFLASSSMMGIICDYLFPLLFKNRQWLLFFYSALLLAGCFSLSLDSALHWRLPLLFVVGALIWGVYFELIMFAQQDFVVSETKPTTYTQDWSLITSVSQLSLIIGPLIAALILDQGNQLFPWSGLFLALAACCMLPLALISRTPKNRVTTAVLPTPSGNDYPRASLHHSLKLLLRETRYWTLFLGSLFPILAVSFLLNIIQALYQTIGGLYGQSLTDQASLAALPVMVFNISMIPGMLLLSFFPLKIRKKRWAMISLTICGLVLAQLAWLPGTLADVIFIIALSSGIKSAAWPLIEAVYSDVLRRAGKSSLHLLGLQKASASLAFIVGPLIIGALSEYMSYQHTFAIVGTLVCVGGITLLASTPLKMRLPQRQLAEIGA